MNLDAWEAALDDYVAEVSRNTGEMTDTAQADRHVPFPIAYRFITEDVIRLFASAIGDSNPSGTPANMRERRRGAG